MTTRRNPRTRTAGKLSQPPANPNEGYDHPAYTPDEHPDALGDPSAWAEDVRRGPYSKGTPPANPDEGHDHPATRLAGRAQYERLVAKKALLCTHIAEAELKQSGRVASESRIEKRASALMDYSTDELVSMAAHLSASEDDSEDVAADLEKEAATRRLQRAAAARYAADEDEEVEDEEEDVDEDDEEEMAKEAKFRRVVRQRIAASMRAAEEDDEDDEDDSDDEEMEKSASLMIASLQTRLASLVGEFQKIAEEEGSDDDSEDDDDDDEDDDEEAMAKEASSILARSKARVAKMAEEAAEGEDAEEAAEEETETEETSKEASSNEITELRKQVKSMAKTLATLLPGNAKKAYMEEVYEDEIIFEDEPLEDVGFDDTDESDEMDAFFDEVESADMASDDIDLSTEGADLMEVDDYGDEDLPMLFASDHSEKEEEEEEEKTASKTASAKPAPRKSSQALNRVGSVSAPETNLDPDVMQLQNLWK